MKQELSSETVDELKKKLLELYDVINKQNDFIKKYQDALEIASIDMVKSIEECAEECNACPEQIYCQVHRQDTIHLDCGEIILESWKEKAGVKSS